jgi:2-C-methyl-D-erythritol 2,4-cyclodiphosphate synthase
MIRIGHGYDVHKLVEGRKLILGGVDIPHETGLLGHSDADVLTHAVMDALLGAIGEGDIGRHFPDSDDRYKGICSMRLLFEVLAIVRSRGYTLGNLDVTVIAQKPRLAAHIPQIIKSLADAFGCEIDRINVKATTEEGLGFTGALLGMAAHAVCTLYAE